MALDNEEKSLLSRTSHFFRIYWKSIFVLLWPFICLPYVIVCDNSSVESRCGYVVLLMAGYWVTECLPLAMTALMPIVLFPCLNILSIKDTCECYMNDVVMYFIGSQILAIAIEHSKLHLRVALKVMQVFGYTHKRLLAGTILATTFLSMWITSATATVMMVPIVLTILSELERVDIGKVFHNLRNPEDANSGPIPTKVTMAYLLGMAYAATFGGTATLFGTATNLVFKGIFEQVFLCAPKIGFDQWMLYSAPLAYANAFITWLYLIVMYFGEVEPNGHYASIDTIGSEGANTVKRVLKEKYDDLGKVTAHEVGVAIMYIIVVVLLLTRKPGFATGWVDIIPGRKIPESAPMILVPLLMFLIPKDLNFLNICSTDENKIPKAPSKSLIAWKLVETKIPWGLMFLLGAGVAMSQAIKKSGLAETLEKSMTPVQSLSAFDILVIVCIIVGTITEVTPEIARANIMLPVVASMAVVMKVNPLCIMMPVTIMCSYSFRLPTGTASNAIITEISRLPRKKFMYGGCCPSIYSLLLVIFCGYWIIYVNQTEKLPYWAHLKNHIDEDTLRNQTCDSFKLHKL